MRRTFTDRIATEIMGWHIDASTGYWLDADGIETIERERWQPDRNIEQAWGVVEKISGVTDRKIEGFPWSSRFAFAFDASYLWAYRERDAASCICKLAAMAAGLTTKEEEV